jgi:predicted Zn-dependent protease
MSVFVASCAIGGPESDKERRALALQRGEAAAWHEIQAKRITEIGTRLTKIIPDGDPLAFYVLVGGGRIEPGSINAFTDGKSVFVTEGMVRFVKNDNELALILAHEIAHIRRGHLVATQGRYVFTGILALPAVIFAGPLAGRVLQELVFAATRSFDRDQEREADLYAFIWMHQAGFDVDSGSDFFQRLAKEKPATLESGFFSSHPTSTERLERMQKIAEIIKKGLDPLRVLAVSAKENAPSTGGKEAAPRPDNQP